MKLAFLALAALFACSGADARSSSYGGSHHSSHYSGTSHSGSHSGSHSASGHSSTSHSGGHSSHHSAPAHSHAPTHSHNSHSGGSHASAHSSGTPHAGSHGGHKKASGVARDSHGKIERSRAARDSFMKKHPCPSTGKTHGSCPGYVVDHVQALKHGGQDAPSNMQWQTVGAAKAKDKVE